MIYDMIGYMIWHITSHDIIWYIYVYDIWYMIYDSWYMIYDIWYDMIRFVRWHDMIYDMICGMIYDLIYDIWYDMI